MVAAVVVVVVLYQLYLVLVCRGVHSSLMERSHSIPRQ